MANVVSCASLCPHGTTDRGWSLAVAGGDRSLPRVSWWVRTLEMVYCLGRRGLVERKRGWRALEECPSLLVPCGSQSPRSAALPCAVLLPGAVWVPLCQIQNENQQKLWGMLGPGEEQPLPSPLHQPGTAQGCSARAQRSQEPPEWAQTSPKAEFDGKATPKHGSSVRSSAGAQSHLPSWERARPWLLGQPKNVLE